jgi:hypothetical protein
MASLNAGAVVIVSAFALKVRSPIFGSFAQNGYCWRIQEELLTFPKSRLHRYFGITSGSLVTRPEPGRLGSSTFSQKAR